MKITTSAERVKAMLAHDPYAVTREPFPAPVVSSLDALASLLAEPRSAPKPCVDLENFARGHGWDVRMQYAQGNYPHAITGRPGALKDSIALRFGAHPLTDRQAYAVYVRNAKPAGTWAWEFTSIWGPDLPPYTGCGITEIKAFLTMSPVTSGEVMKLWVEELRLIKINGEGLRAQRDQDRKEIRAQSLAGDGWDVLMRTWEPRGYSREDLIKIINTTSRAAEREGMR